MRAGVLVSLIAAVSDNGVIGKEGGLPWHLPEDLKWFKRTTQGHAVVMGRKTYASLDGPLPRRVNVVLTRDGGYEAAGAKVVHTWDQALAVTAEAEQAAGGDEMFVLGGEQVYRLAMGEADRLYLTRVHATVAGDARFPAVDEAVWERVWHEAHEADERHAYGYTFERWERRARGA